jgi:hypothetical protein
VDGEPLMHRVHALVVCSGGLDSVTLSHRIAVEQRLIAPNRTDFPFRYA